MRSIFRQLFPQNHPVLIPAGPAPTPPATFGPSINSRMKFFWCCLLFNLALLLLLVVELFVSLGEPTFSGDRFAVLVGLMAVAGLLSLGCLLLDGLRMRGRNRLLAVVPLALMEAYTVVSALVLVGPGLVGR